ncbi:hypothetical protein FC72_GL000202 [Companilactobacillus tucceti DSM 20183]|uniref:Uncharacterized protein n=1 Tax=Companilactobacillus tucceti DSM 20183 TaxID=1423811 RepID=A0A0R1J2X5_9LACO|nr:hypothetical protein [Companilactobacillus tucceti]KRK65757.1 hypothetical protein FC72_GL000202 [Companilactobacillus tucceti DSM 20183]
MSNNTKMGTKKAESGDETLTLYYSGKYKLTVFLNGYKKSKILTVKPFRTNTDELLDNNKSSSPNNESSSSSNDSSKKTMIFGQSDMVGKGNLVAQIQIDSVQKVDANNDMVTDISHNYEGMKQYVLVNYTVTAIKGTVPLDDFDGSELSVADSNGTIGTQSSNRDNGIPDTLTEGQNAQLRIGVGLKHDGINVTVGFNNLSWQGQIQ